MQVVKSLKVDSCIGDSRYNAAKLFNNPVMQAIDYAKKANQSFTLPEMCIRIRQLLDDDASSIEHIAELVSMDPSLTSKLLKLANSALFRFPAQIDSLDKALSIIGGEALYNLLMAETAATAISHFANDAVDIQRFWLQSVYAGLIAKHLAKIAKVRGSERFFLLGLLHNLGELVVADQNPDIAAKGQQYDQQVSPWRLQQQLLGFTYAECSGQLLAIWQLPNNISTPVLQANIESRALQSKDVGIVFTALRAAMAVVEDKLYSVNQLVNPLVLTKLDLEEEALFDAIKFARMESMNILSVISN